jgi:branched-chain amino acid transport system permease protein
VPSDLAMTSAAPAAVAGPGANVGESLLPAGAESLFAVHSADNLRQNRRSLLIGLLLVLALATVPLWSTGSFSLGRYGVAITYVMAAVGLNLAIGFAGELVLGHAAIMAISAYVSGILSAQFGWNFGAALPAGIVAGAAFGFAMMSPGLRVRGWYLSLLTLFAVLVLPRASNLLTQWTGGDYGLTGIRRAEIFGIPLTEIGIFECSVACFATVWFATTNFIRSGWGQRLQALRDIPRAAQASGIDLVYTRLVVYIVASIPAATAGALLAYIEQFVNAESFGMGLTLLLLTGVMAGGSGTLWGPIVGMVPLIALSFWVGPFSPYNAIGLGLGLLTGSIAFPDGVIPAFKRRRAPLASVIDDVGGNEKPASVPLRAPSAAGQSSIHLRVSGVTKHFGGVMALAGVDFELRRGALTGVVGPNGSGKSTLLNMLSGFSVPDGGSIELNGAAITDWPVHQIAKSGIGRTFQVPQLIDKLTAVENIEISLVGQMPDGVLASIIGLPSVVARAKKRRLLAFETFKAIGLPSRAIVIPVAELSLGLKRIVELGRAIAPAPELLLLDEPAAGLNAQERAVLGETLRTLRDQGMTVLVVEHNVPFVREYCDELILLESGAIAAHASLSASEPLPDRLTDYLSYMPGSKPVDGAEA